MKKIKTIKDFYDPCDHPTIIGDDYGTSCQVCGEQLEGLGAGARNKPKCIHKFSNDGICVFCEADKGVKYE
jgi:hypothetical protein